MPSEDRIVLVSDSMPSLDAFDSEFDPTPPPSSAEPASNPAPAQVRTSASVSLADLEAAGIRTDWYEATAIAGALCRSILDAGDQVGPAKVDASEIFISPNGGVTTAVRGPRSTPAAIEGLGRLLDRLLPDHDVMFLRPRLVSKATSSPPHYHSLEELGRAIAYYERPNRAQVIQGVYLRYHNQLPQAPSAVSIPKPATVAAPAAETPGETTPRRAAGVRINRTAAYVFVGSISLGAIAGVAALVLRLPSPDQLSPVQESSVESADGRANPSKGLHASTAASSRGPRLSASRTETQASGHQAGNAAAAMTFGPMADRQVPAGSKGLETGSFALSRKPSLFSVPDRAHAALNNRLGFEEPPAPDAIFTATDRDVVPPSVLYPHYLTASSSGRGRPDIFLVEIVVNERGEVEAVKGRDEPRTIGDSLFLTNALSAAKSWRFNPALKGSYRVRYRHLFELARY